MKNKYKTLIISCWVVLIIYFIIKILGGNYFNIEVEWKNLIEACSFLDKNPLLSCFVKAPFYSISSYFVYLTITKKKFKDDYWVALIFLLSPFLKRYLTAIGFILDGIMVVVIPYIVLIKNKKEKPLYSLIRVFIANLLLIAFEVISGLTRNIGYYIPLTNNTLIGLILSIDYYIMVILYYLHTREYIEKREVN